MSKPTHSTSAWKVLGLYAAGSWIVLQIVDVLGQNLGLPPWVFSLALVLLIAGLPILGATAYLQGLGARDTVVPGPTTAPRTLFTWKNALLGGGAALALWGLVVTGWLVAGPGSGGSAGDEGTDLRSVAVLPFVTRATQSDEEALIFSEGMHDDLLTQLSKIEALTVISRTSVMQYAGTTKPIPDIAMELGVATVLEGGVQRAGNRVRINVQLIEAATDRHLWAETYDEELTAANIFAIQTDLSRKIAGALRATLTPETESRIATRPTESLEAFDLNARARHILNDGSMRTGVALRRALDLAEQAVAADSGYAEAWTVSADLYLQMYNLAVLPPEEALPKAEAALDRAAALDPELAQVHSARGRLLMAQLRYDEAETSILRALELNPGSAEVHRSYSRLLVQIARIDEAVAEARRAVELDPLSLTARASYSDALFWAGDWEGTEAETLTLIEMSPNDAYAHYNLGFARTMMGEFQAGVDAFVLAQQYGKTDAYNTAGLAWSLAMAGRRDSALVILSEVPEHGAFLKEIAIVYGTLGDLDLAFEYLDRLAEEDPGIVGQLRTDPTADPLKADPRYEQLLRRVGL